MPWFEAFIHAAVALHTYELLAFFAVTVVIGRLSPVSNKETVRMLAGITVVHIAAVALAIWQGSHAPERTLGFVALALSSSGIAIAIVASVFRLLLPRFGIHPPRILVDIIMAVAIAVMLVYTSKRAGFSVTGLITTSAVITAVIGFALQDTLGNIMGGLALQMDASVAVGDWISMGPGQPQGRVVEIRWRYVAIETRAWETIIIPNSMLMKSQVTVLGKRVGQPVRLRRQIDFQVDFRTPPGVVIDAVSRALLADPVPNMATEPAPHVLLIAIRDSFAQYCVRYWITDLASDDPPDSDVRVRVLYALARAEIAPAIPAQALAISQDTDERAAARQAAGYAERLAVLQGTEIFSKLEAPILEQLARDLRPAAFVRGEAIAREGEIDDGLFMIVSGRAVVRIGAKGKARDVATLVPGQFFGEMSLMTGEPRSASVIALENLDCYRLRRESFERIIRDHPSIAELIAELFADRKVALDAARDGLVGEQKARRASTKSDFLGRIRDFFAIHDEP
jgi:small-conductance mechanosensitive channel/CRP-like cAMP-binding protein